VTRKPKTHTFVANLKIKKNDKNCWHSIKTSIGWVSDFSNTNQFLVSGFLNFEILAGSWYLFFYYSEE
jgi:hypothetical protein